ncbi:MAG: GAF domain-containing protein, partial [Myxococcales bacterium]|nr:GAF domain-containing protein [Myxococcales bacterium]
ALASVLKNHARIDLESTDILVVGHVVEVRRREATCLCVPTWTLPERPLAEHLGRLSEGRAGLLLVGETPGDLLAELPPGVVVQVIDEGVRSDTVYFAVESILDRVELRLAAERRTRSLSRYEKELGDLIEIARTITQERNIDRLLDTILATSRRITGADAGSIYVVDRNTLSDGVPRKITFKLSQNDSCPFESSEFELHVSRQSIVGAAVLDRRPINIPDVYAIGPEASYGFDSSFDEKVGYRTRSMITVPLISAQDEVIGVIQLINRKESPGVLLTDPDRIDELVVPFEERDQDLLLTLASQAGIALENALLYDEIKRIFEGFVRASVQAIEQRDPTTSGHSLRVSVLTTKLAEVVDRADDGPFGGVTFTHRQMKELEYAAMLHDFGKIGVREEVLVKAKKLYPSEMEAVRARFDYALARIERESLEGRLRAVAAGAGQSDLDAIEDELQARKEVIARYWHTVEQANEPTVLKEGDFSTIAQIGQMMYRDARNEDRPLLEANEIASLQVQKGSLNDRELEEIRSHVLHTREFLERIPWGKDMLRIPEIAGAHHEKLNGTGYPKGLASEAIPLESKIMTIADIYDALTARDRPYKRAIPIDRALQILDFEVKADHVDGNLVQLFREAKVYDVLTEDLSY